MSCVARAVSWATWLLFTGVLARCIVLGVRYPGPLGSCSPVCMLGVLCCVCGVLGHLAPVHRCSRGACCAVCCVCRVACAGRSCGVRTRPSRRRLFVAGMGWVPPGRTLVDPDGGCYVAGRGGVRCRARTSPSGLQLFVAGRGWVPSGRALVHRDGACSLASRGCVRCRARTRQSRRRLMLLGTCSRAVVRCVLCALSGFAAPGGRCCLAPVRVPWSWPRMVRHTSSGPVALGDPVGFPDAVMPFTTTRACAPCFTWRLRGARRGGPRTRLIVPAAGPRRGRGAGLAPRSTRSGPRDGVVPGGSLWRWSWAACAAVVGACGPGQ